MSIQHSAITDDADNHEPKGCPTAAVNTVYVADGAGSGAWQSPSAIATYGELYIAAGAGTQTLSAASAYAKLDPTTHWANGASQNVTLAGATAQMTVPSDGAYNVSFWVVFETAAIASGTKYYFKYAVNGTPVARIISTAKITNNVDTCDTSASGIAVLSAGDILSIYVAGDGTSSSTAITVKEAGLTLHKV